MAKRKKSRVSATSKKPLVRKAAKALKAPVRSAAPTKGKWFYAFGGGKADGKPNMRNLLGGKGAGLAEMASLGLPVPPGFTITTEVCTFYYANKQQYPKELTAQVTKALARVGEITGKIFGDQTNPLLVSVRSGARASMPGMMDTVLNLGLNDETCAGLAKRTSSKRFALDAYRRFISMYATIAMGAKKDPFDHAMDELRAELGKNKGIDPTRMN